MRVKAWKSINENLAGFLARWAGKETVPFGIKDRMFEIDKTKQARSLQILLSKLRKNPPSLRLACVGAGEIF
jgi:hypothetical protein